MKKENENVPEIDPELHQRLCAYVFGELAGAERAAFEAELLRSPALRAEQARLSSTVELVRSAVPDERLSGAVRRDLLASAKRSRFRFLSGRNLARVAAAGFLILGGVLGSRMFTGRWPASGYDVRDAKVAKAPEPQALKKERVADLTRAKETRNLEEAAPEGLRDLAYGGDAAPAAAPAAPTTVPAPAEVVEMLEALGYGGGDGAPADCLSDGLSVIDRASVPAVEHQEATESYFLAQNPPPATAQSPSLFLPIAGAQQTSLGVGQGGHAGTGTPSAFVSRRAGSGTTSTSSQGARAVLQDKLGLPQRAAGNVYRGPGDPVPRQKVVQQLTPLAPTGGTPIGTGGTPIGVVPVQPLQQLGYVDTDDPADERRKDDAARQQREPVLTREQVAARVDELLTAARVAPGETPGDMFFRYWGDAPFVLTYEQATSTFAADVDTASYALARSYLGRGTLPPREAVRTEEFVNYFRADQPPPTDGQPFAIGMELAPSLFANDSRAEMLRVTVRARDVQDFERRPLALTFVIDNSGSMQEGGRLELVKRALSLLLRQLYLGDSVAVVKFSNDASVVTQMLPASRRSELEGLILGLPIEGGTNVEAGLRKGYEVAQKSLARNAVNRVILCSDGVGNIGETNAKGILALVDEARAKGIYLNTVGVGMGNHDDAFLEELADRGDGMCNYVDSDAEAKRVFVDTLSSALQPVARDVKIQVEFDPAQVESWRLIGYENRALREQDFRDDRIDAGEVNAGHQVTALYELVRLPSRSQPLATVRLRYKPPFAIDQGKEGQRATLEAEAGQELERTLSAAAVLPGFAGGTAGYQRAVLVAQFAEVLRQSVHARGDSFARLLEESRRLARNMNDADFAEFVTLLEKANPLLDQRTKQETPRVLQLLDELSGLHYGQALRERKQELARKAGEPEKPLDERQAEERKELADRDTIRRLEAEVSAELQRDKAGLLQDLGYGGRQR